MTQSTNGNSDPGAPAAGMSPADPAAQQLIVNAQYIKDLSFENPRAPQSLTQQTAARRSKSMSTSTPRPSAPRPTRSC